MQNFVLLLSQLGLIPKIGYQYFYDPLSIMKLIFF